VLYYEEQKVRRRCVDVWQIRDGARRGRFLSTPVLA
jgi:hypothetical protein